MFLEQFCQYQKIVIQCHDNPDADTIGAGFALYQYFFWQGKQVSMVYGGSQPVSKPNMLQMLEMLHIPLEHVDQLPETDLLLLVDCQYKEGNVTCFEAPQVACIDHHREGERLTYPNYIKSNYGSCCTVCWSLLRETDFQVNENANLATAMYFGLYQDTGAFSEISHPMDKDMHDALVVNQYQMNQLVNANLTAEELILAGEGLSNAIFNEEYKYALLEMEPCDSNVLGIIADLLIQVDSIEMCIVYNQLDYGIKYSVRSCTNEINAAQVAKYLAGDYGNGGGHYNKAGGYIVPKEAKKVKAQCDFQEYFQEKMRTYFSNCQLIYARKHTFYTKKLTKYRNLPIIYGVIPLAEYVKGGTPLVIRTLEGDLELLVGEDRYLMVGSRGEIYPISREKFGRMYHMIDGNALIKSSYEPTVINSNNGHVYSLKEYVRACRPNIDYYVYAKPLECNMKLFTRWDESQYLWGNIGDYLVFDSEDKKEVSIIAKDIFEETYERLEK